MQLKSYCKVNLFLEILSKRKDGYHNIDTLFHSVSLYDRISFEEIDSNEIKIECSIGELNSDDNILWRVIDNLKSYFPANKKGLRIAIEKNIPMGAGLGGGSSNAAFALLGLNRYYNLGLNNNMLMEIGSQLGADVAFFIRGGFARGEGIGEKLSFYEDINYKLYFLIVYPNIHASTKEAYDGLNLNNNNIKRSENIKELIEGLRNRDLNKICKNVYNQFEESQFKKQPILAEIKVSLIKNGALCSLMSGSGSSIFGIFDSMTMAERAYNKLESLGYRLFLAESVFKY